MQLGEKVQCLIAIGASIGADCEPCLRSCTALARQCGADEQEIEAATAIARRVKHCAAKAEKRADSRKEKLRADEKGYTACCGSDQTNTEERRSI